MVGWEDDRDVRVWFGLRGELLRIPGEGIDGENRGEDEDEGEIGGDGGPAV